jgi:hypothetical protein
VRSGLIVKAEVGTEAAFGLKDVGIGPEINLLVFHRTPEPLDEDVVQTTPLAVHRDLDAVGQQHAGKLQGGKLTALVCVEDLRHAVQLNRLFIISVAQTWLERSTASPRSKYGWTRCAALARDGFGFR